MHAVASLQWSTVSGHETLFNMPHVRTLLSSSCSRFKDRDPRTRARLWVIHSSSPSSPSSPSLPSRKRHSRRQWPSGRHEIDSLPSVSIGSKSSVSSSPLVSLLDTPAVMMPSRMATEAPPPYA